MKPNTFAGRPSRVHQTILRRAICEVLEKRLLLTASNAIDEIDFGNAASESAHDFDAGDSALPPSGTGALGLTYREIAGPASGTGTGANNEVLTFTMTVDPFEQNYLTIKLWGSDTTPGVIYLYNSAKGYNIANYDQSSTPWLDWQVSGGQPAFPGRFYYDTTPIPLSWTQGNTSVTLTLNAAENYERYSGDTTVQLAAGQTTRPIYSAYVTTNPDFVPDSSSATGSAPAATSPTLGTVSSSQALSLLQSIWNSTYSGSSSYFSTVTARQIQPGTSGAPAEVIGLDLFTNQTTWLQTSHTAAQWDAQIASQLEGPGYTALPDELLSVLSVAYLTPRPTGVTGANDQYSPTLLKDIVEALDGSTYEQGSDGGFPCEGGAWVGLTAAGGQRTPVGTSGYLQGIDCQVFGDVILALLDDPTGGPAFTAYLGETYDANLDGSAVLRATAYERMLYENMNYLETVTGGTSSQNLFQVLGVYADQVGLEKLQQLFPNSAYPALPVAVGLNFAEQVLGLAPTTFRGPWTTHYALSGEGLGLDANNNFQGGYDRGYGQWFPQLALQMAKLAEEDPGVSTSAQRAEVAQIAAQADNTVTAYDQFLSTNLYATTSNGTTTYESIISPDDVVSTRNPNNAGNLPLDLDTEFAASNPNDAALYNPLAARSAYLQVEYGQTPELFFDNQTDNSNLQYLRELPDYIATIDGLVNNTPATKLPGESTAGNFAWADVEGGAVAFINNGERVYMTINYRAPEGEVDNVVRIHDTTSTIDRIADVYMPYSGATVQSDGNFTGNFNGAWVVRYGQYLVVLNRGTTAYLASLPQGSGIATDLLTGNTYAMGSNISVAAGQAIIIYLGSTTVTKTAALQPAAQSSGAVASIVAGYPTATLTNGQTISLSDAVFDASGNPLTTVPDVNWVLQSGIGSIDLSGNYTAPLSGTGSATIVATYDGITSSPITINVVPLLPGGQDIGTVGVAGSDSYSSGVYTIAGAGSGIAGSTDSFRYLNQAVDGDLTLITQVTSQTNPSSSAFAGLMVRGALTATSPFVAVGVTPANSVEFIYRAAAGAATTVSASVSSTVNLYLKLVRTGADGSSSTFSAYYSSNYNPTTGTGTWTQVGTSQSIAVSSTGIPDASFFGLAVTSGTTSATSTATFANVSLTRPSSEIPTVTSITYGLHGNVWAQLIPTTSANSGAATLTDTWSVEQSPVNSIPGHFSTFDGGSFYAGASGTYILELTVTNSDGLFSTGTVTVNFPVTLMTMTALPSSPLVFEGASEQFTAAAFEQFGQPMTTPSNVTWKILSGGGSITSAGLFTAPTTAGLTEIQATSGSITATDYLDIIPSIAAQSGSTLNISLNPAGPVSVGPASGGGVTVSQNGAQIAFTGITGVTVTDTASNDVLNFNGPLALPFTFISAGSSTINVNAGTLTFAANMAGTINLGTLSVAAGAGAVILPTTTNSPTTLVLNALSLGTSGVLDVANNEVLINYGSGTDPISTIASWIASGYAGGAWNGPGIISSVAQSNPSYGLGYADAADAGNPANLASGQIEILYTLLGDANLDGKVNGTDFVLMSAGFNQSVTAGWDKGDFNYDGKINGDDFVLLSDNFNQFAQIAAAAVTPASNSVAVTVSTPAATPQSSGAVTNTKVRHRGKDRS